jgi:hypothetical protein
MEGQARRVYYIDPDQREIAAELATVAPGPLFVPVIVDTSQAPSLLRYRYYGLFPSFDEQSLLHDRLMTFGCLTAETRGIKDLRELDTTPGEEVLAKMVIAARQRGWPACCAYLIHPEMIEAFQALAITGVTTAAFVDEDAAMQWLMR